ncbi:MAG: MFS transporter [Anaerolineales bacterium]|nr:MFS transporter [Anaerolineales bacterium]
MPAHQADTPADTSFQTTNVAVISTGHAIHDTYSGFLPSLVPVFIQNLALTRTEAGFLAAMLRVPSILQPIFGRIADKKDLRWLVIAAPALTAVLMSLLGIAPGYGVLVILLLAAGLSSAAFHSVAPVIAGRLSGSKLGRGMGFWMVGGEFGRALGPIFIVTAIRFLGLKGTPWLMLFGIAASLALFLRLRSIPVILAEKGDGLNWREAVRSMLPIQIPVLMLFASTSLLRTSLGIFLPTLLTEQGSGLWLAGAALTIYEAAGVIGALVGGNLSDRIGRSRMLALFQLLAPAGLLLFLRTADELQLVLLIVLGFCSLAGLPILMALIQESFPEKRSFANGFYMAGNFIVSFSAALLIGWLGDSIGLERAFFWSAILSLAGLPFILLLPKAKKSAEGS